MLLGNGSYVSLTTADRQHLTIVVQTLVLIILLLLNADDAFCDVILCLHNLFSGVTSGLAWFPRDVHKTFRICALRFLPRDAMLARYML